MAGSPTAPDFLAAHPFIRYVVSDKIRGAIVGSALGDCVGLYTEFLNKPMIKAAYPEGKFSLTGNVTQFCADSHRCKFTEGSWTDDTDHCLLVILSFLHTDGKVISEFDFARRLRTWIEQGLLCLERLPLGLGRTTGSVVTSKRYLEDPKTSAFRNWAVSRFSTAANGSLMRTYPIGIMCLNKSLQDTFKIAAELSLVTHTDPRCVVSCCIASALVRGMLLGEVQDESNIESIVEDAAAFVETMPQMSIEEASRHETIVQDPDRPLGSPPRLDRQELYLHTKATDFAVLELDDLRKQGYVYKCLGSSILCLRLAMRRARSASKPQNTVLATRDLFEDLITNLVLEGGDADTNAAVAGSFLGCFLGFSSLPPHWYGGVQNINWLLRKSDCLIHVLNIEECAVGYIGSEDPDTKEDGGKGILDLEQLKAREMAFMEMYLRKSGNIKGLKSSTPQTDNVAQGLLKKWKGVFG